METVNTIIEIISALAIITVGILLMFL
jgi:hypothetical protein